ncbi:hypothetical protein SteCoe_31422 [Stentor coeruleus]|uniref:Trichohyalin-plectin-homology domain-containing protein n=1 Tax=Stentor coeruleus TaxID=5963 RepID=A0A1R2B1F1_9CILI|nr:hypothetical protein SteCoe_31422 [Stentor coeruleus]
MNKKKQALDELLDGFLRKFGDSRENRLIISEEIEKFMNNRAKIAIRDLDELEEILLYKLNPSKNVFRKFSLSPIDHYSRDPIRNSPLGTLKNIEYRSSSRNIYTDKSTHNDSSLISHNSRLNHKKRDNIIFPTDHVPEDVYSKTTFKKKNPMPTLKNNRVNYDQWGKILKAESVKYQKEIEIYMKKHKEAKLDYSLQLSKQIEENNKKRLELKAERDSEVEFLGKIVNNYELEKEQKKFFKQQLMLKQKEEYEKVMLEKANKMNQKLQTMRSDKELLNKTYVENQKEEQKKQEIKEKQIKDIEQENLTNAKQKKIEITERRVIDSQKDLLHLENAQVSFGENENKHRKLVYAKALIAHDEDRMMRLLKNKPKTLKDYENEANMKEQQDLLLTIQEEKILKKKKIDESKKKNEEITKILEKQMKDNLEKKQEFMKMVKEQGEIWKNEDDDVIEKQRVKKEMNKKRQKEIRDTLDRQIKEKEQKLIEDLQFTPVEMKINKNIYTSAVKILGEN